MMNRANRQTGFGLIEVMVAFVVIAVSAAALIKLQSLYLKTEGEAGSRESAILLAQSKLEDLRVFDTLSTTTGQLAYQDIGDNTGGQLSAGSHTLGLTTFTLSWDVTDRFLTTPASALPEFKDVIVSVAWTDREGQSRSLALAGVISPQQTTDKELMTGSGGSGESPQVTYTPGVAPDVVAITIDVAQGVKQETTKPLPKVSNSGGSIQVQFETVTYDQQSSKQVLADSLTLSCECSIDGTAKRQLPAKPVAVSNGLLYWQEGDYKDKTTGTSNSNQQSDLCDICCEDHFDGGTSSGTDFADYFNPINRSPAKYKYAGSSLTAVTSGPYLDACRLLRINGYYKPMPDWNLLQLVVVSSEFLSDSNNQQSYQNYVKYVVKSYVDWQKDTLNWPSGIGSTFSVSNFPTWLATNAVSGGDTSTALVRSAGSTPLQLIARGIFVDFMSADWLATVDTSAENFLTKVPFYDINMTMLARWSVSSTVTMPKSLDSYLTVSSELIKTLDSDVADYYGVYRRGYTTPLLETKNTSGNEQALQVNAVAYQANSGISPFQDNKAEWPVAVYDSAHQVTGSLNFTIKDKTIEDDEVSVSAKLFCYKRKNGAVDVCDSNGNNKAFDLITASFTNGSNCSLGGAIASSYRPITCNVTKGKTLSVTTSNTPTGYTVSPNPLTKAVPADQSGPLFAGCIYVYDPGITSTQLPACTQ
ncbi:prepilin-type N-terminal cleavage/methylation domain-containing protein [Pseudaeromonas paramecii]|uniref:Prepilin-type N-terminal cleavage/methylation domain-containing protein n=2 Tax=Pseudaeromonas paramecii TaxID=2138166 RepID=A0ABP8QAI8_9GAMM